MMMIKERRDMKPFLVKFGVALALSFAGYICSRIRTKRIKPFDPSPPPVSESDKNVDFDGRSMIKDDPQPETDSDKPCIRVQVDSSSQNASLNGTYSADGDGYTLHERDAYEQEIESLKRRIQIFFESLRKIEIQLLELYGLKEQETAMLELQNRLKIHNVVRKVFMFKIKNLQQENKRLGEKVADYVTVMTELEDAKEKIELLKRKIRSETEQNKEQVLDLTQRVLKLPEHEHEVNTSHFDEQSDFQRVTELEAEAEELRKCNEYLQQENTDLAQRLESPQILANSLFEVPEQGFNSSNELHHALFQLREENEKLKTEVERFQVDRCAVELVYLRWTNACLRYKLSNYQPPPGKTIARDLSKCRSPTSEKKVKQLILEYANTEQGADRVWPRGH